jgi:hypothetical protein
MASAVFYSPANRETFNNIKLKIDKIDHNANSVSFYPRVHDRILQDPSPKESRLSKYGDLSFGYPEKISLCC